MAKKRIPHSAEFKTKVALDALREQKTLAELSQDYKLQSTQISAWKSALQEGAALVFDKHSSLKQREEYEAREQELYARIGQLQMELEWVKKSWTCHVHGRGAAWLDRTGASPNQHCTAM
jgi:transposase-like protein